jgi:hypothetical protein
MVTWFVTTLPADDFSVSSVYFLVLLEYMMYIVLYLVYLFQPTEPPQAAALAAAAAEIVLLEKAATVVTLTGPVQVLTALPLLKGMVVAVVVAVLVLLQAVTVGMEKVAL